MAIRHTRGRLKTIGVASLVDNTVGAVNSTLQAIPNPGGTLITDLITDLTTNTVPALRNNFADLAAKVNVIIVALKANGILGD